jgi:hypothetical protein
VPPPWPAAQRQAAAQPGHAAQLQAGRALPTRARERIRAAPMRGVHARSRVARGRDRGRGRWVDTCPAVGATTGRATCRAACHLSRGRRVAHDAARRRDGRDGAGWAGWAVAGAGCVVVPARERRRRARCARALHGAPLAARAGGGGPSLPVRGSGTRGYSRGYGTRSRDLAYKWYEGEYEE